MPASGPRSHGARVHPRPCQGCKPWPRSSAAFGLVLATQKLGGITGRGTRGGGRDLNPRPPGPQPGALPTELPPPRTAQNSRFGPCVRGPAAGLPPVRTLSTNFARVGNGTVTKAQHLRDPNGVANHPTLGPAGARFCRHSIRGVSMRIRVPRSGRSTRPGRVPPRARLRRRRGRPEHDRGLATLIGPAQPGAHGARSPPE